MGIPHAIGVVVFALTCGTALAAPQQARVTGQVPGAEKIHYDYLEDGVLTGGFIRAERDNPLHTATAPESSLGAPYVTLVENGPNSNRIDVTFVGDGYRTPDLPDYAQHVQNFFNVFFAEHPLDAYATYFNVYRVDVVSAETGVDHDPTNPTWKNTALDMGFFCSGIERLLCVNVSKARSAANSAPARELVVAVANSSKYGGAGYNDLATFAGGNGSAFEVALHEIGHSLPDLADEYHYSDGATHNGGELPEANVSNKTAATMAAQQTRWFRWLDEPNVSTFEGARYKQYGIYRPTNNSKMRSLGRPFEQVNAEQFILEFYRYVQPIDAATPAGTYYGAATVLSVIPVQPVSHALTVQWTREGVDIPGATATDLDVGSLLLPPGIHEIGVRVSDDTPWVRDETARASLMTEERSWTVVLPEFALFASAQTAQQGDTITFSTLGGQPGSAASLMAGNGKGIWFRLPLAQGTMNAQDRWDVQWTVPAGFAGRILEFRVFGTKKAGGDATSNGVSIQFQ